MHLASCRLHQVETRISVPRVNQAVGFSGGLPTGRVRGADGQRREAGCQPTRIPLVPVSQGTWGRRERGRRTGVGLGTAVTFGLSPARGFVT